MLSDFCVSGPSARCTFFQKIPDQPRGFLLRVPFHVDPADLRIPPEGKDYLTTEIDQSGVVTVTLEGKAKRVTDLFTGEEIARDTAEFTLKSEKPHTWLLGIE